MAINGPLPGMEQESPNPGSQLGSKRGPHDLLIDVLGTSFSITAGEEPEYLDEVLAQYQFAVANTQGISQMKDPLRVAILTGFLLCDEINKLKQQQNGDDMKEAMEIEQRTLNLITKLEQALKTMSNEQ